MYLIIMIDFILEEIHSAVSSLRAKVKRN